ncbi:MAG TPA: hypothetical protein PLU58_06570 [Saprospiraceae bacterium]|nr:hypothetical protein [Saprospiraceae bacterium]
MSLISFLLIRQTIQVITFDRKITKMLPDDEPSDDEWVVVMYKDKEIPMKYLEKLEIWDNMSGKEKSTMVKKLDLAIKRGKAVPENFARIRHQLKTYEE